MLSRIREKYGRQLLCLPPLADHIPRTLHAFPTLRDLSGATLEELKSIGLGYRAKYLLETSRLLLQAGGEPYLLHLRGEPREVVQQHLQKFPGIGRKVADCIALFSLDQTEAIPVDVHVQNIANRDYDPTLFQESKSLTPTLYNRIGDIFRDLFPSHAGWAHSLLFVAELPSFRPVLPQDVKMEMDQWKKQELQKKAILKKAKMEKKKLHPTRDA